MGRLSLQDTSSSSSSTTPMHGLPLQDGQEGVEVPLVRPHRPRRPGRQLQPEPKETNHGFQGGTRTDSRGDAHGFEGGHATRIPLATPATYLYRPCADSLPPPPLGPAHVRGLVRLYATVEARPDRPTMAAH